MRSACYKPREPTRGPEGPLRAGDSQIEPFLPILVAALQTTPSLPPVGLGLLVAFIVISLGVHEAAHGWTALKCGDTTARDLGRITLNPLPHIDPFMTVVMPVISFYALGFPFGGARPVPVNFHALRHGHRDMALVAIAGPLSNILIATVVFVAYHGIVDVAGIWGTADLGARVLYLTIVVNLLLAVFNLLPLPPLDGSRVMTWLLPRDLRPAYVRLEAYGLLLVLAVIWFVPPVWDAIEGGIWLLYSLIEHAVTLGGVW